MSHKKAQNSHNRKKEIGFLFYVIFVPFCG